MSKDSRHQNGRNLRTRLSDELAFAQGDATKEQIAVEITDEVAAAMQRDDLKAETMLDFGVVDDTPKPPFTTKSDGLDPEKPTFYQTDDAPVFCNQLEADVVAWREAEESIWRSHQRHYAEVERKVLSTAGSPYDAYPDDFDAQLGNMI